MSHVPARALAYCRRIGEVPRVFFSLIEVEGYVTRLSWSYCNKWQVGVDGKGQARLSEATVSGVSYEPVGTVEGLASDAMEHGGMKNLASVSMTT